MSTGATRFPQPYRDASRPENILRNTFESEFWDQFIWETLRGLMRVVSTEPDNKLYGTSEEQWGTNAQRPRLTGVAGKQVSASATITGRFLGGGTNRNPLITTQVSSNGGSTWTGLHLMQPDVGTTEPSRRIPFSITVPFVGVPTGDVLFRVLIGGANGVTATSGLWVVTAAVVPVA